MTEPWLVAPVGALLGAGGITALLKARSENRKVDAQAEVTLGGGWHELWKSARSELNELRERLAIVEEKERVCQARLLEIETHARQSIAEVERKVLTLLDKRIATQETPGG